MPQVIPIVIAAVGAAASIYSSKQQANAAEEAGAYNNELAQREARNRERTAAEAIRRERAANEARLGAIRASLSNSGTLSTEGSPLTVLGESAGRFELGVADAARSASMQAASMRAQGAMGLWEADQRSNAAIMGGVATGIRAAGSMYSDYQSGSQLGMYTRTKTTP